MDTYGIPVRLRAHAVARQGQRAVTTREVQHALGTGCVIERDRRPERKSGGRYPLFRKVWRVGGHFLVRGVIDGQVVHIACVVDRGGEDAGRVAVLTVYRPDRTRWDRHGYRRLSRDNQDEQQEGGERARDDTSAVRPARGERPAGSANATVSPLPRGGDADDDGAAPRRRVRPALPEHMVYRPSG